MHNREFHLSKLYFIVATLIPGAIVPIGLTLLFNTQLSESYWINIALHSLVEGVGSIIAVILAVFIIIMRINNQLRPRYLWVASTMLVMGLLDGFHAAITPGEAFIWLHSLATLAGGIVIALVILPEHTSLHLRLQWTPHLATLFAITTGITSLLLPDWIPVMQNGGQFTLFAQMLNIVGGIGFISAWIHYTFLERHILADERLLLANHCLLFGVAALLFQESSLWDLTWWLWHLLRLAAYLALLIFFVRLYHQETIQLQLSKNVIKYTDEGVIITDLDGHICDVNQAYESISGFPCNKLLNTPYTPLIVRQMMPDKYLELRQQLKSKGHWSGEIWEQHHDGHTYPIHLTINAILDANHRLTHYVALITDIRQQKQLEKRLEHLAFYDPLTALPNRTFFLESLQKTLSSLKRNERSGALMMIDLDGFKYVNDTYGHAAGDELLINVSRQLEQRIRNSDLVARFGGDEFFIFINETDDREHLAAMAQQLLRSIEQPISYETHLLYVSASIGIAIYPKDATTVDALFRNADSAMYLAKAAGKDNYKFFQSTNSTT
jgi:diguanylate cyclase (GGDEF)-like protein/PAS domain S-box-containing protein